MEEGDRQAEARAAPAAGETHAPAPISASQDRKEKVRAAAHSHVIGSYRQRTKLRAWYTNTISFHSH
jgi:hypothetical protein